MTLVLPARPRRHGARPLDLLEEPPWPLPRQRPPAPPVRERPRPLHRSGPRGWRGLRGRRQPDRGRCQPPEGRRGHERLAARERQPGRPGVPRRARRRGVRCRHAGRAQVRVAGRSGSALDRCRRWAGRLRPRDQLPRRPRPRDHRRRRAHDRDPAGRGDGGQAHDRAPVGPLRPLPGAAGWRQRRQFGRDVGPARPRAGDRAAHPGVRREPAQGRYLLTRGLRLGPGGRGLSLPSGSHADHDRPPRERRCDPDVPGEPVRLRPLSAEAALLPGRPGPQGAALDPRGRPAEGAGHLRFGGGPDLATPAQEGRDAVCAPQAHPEAGPVAAQGDRTEQGTSSTSLPPPRTCASSPS